MPTTGDGRGTACIFVKPPQPGAVKTRLIPAVGKRGAADLARAFFVDTVRSVSTLAWLNTVVASAPPRRALPITSAPVWPQGEGDLGARLERVLRRALEEAPYAVALGSDAPGMPTSRLLSARAALRDADAVLGPSDDGGFYLLALTSCPKGLLADLPWSSEHTFARTLARLRERGLRTKVIEPWYDVDRPDDLSRLQKQIESGEVIAPSTADVLLRPRISVIIPVLSEQQRLPDRLRELAATPGIHEVIVVDGGSRDRTMQRAQEFAGVTVLSSAAGRAKQMNAGALVATGDVLLFLHADVALPPDMADHVRQALSAPDVVAGAFHTWTVPDGPRTWATPFLHLADVRSRITSRPYGDQALFVRAGAFVAAGGFPDQPLMEDVELSRRLSRLGRIKTVRARVTVSGRRFQKRPLFYTLLVNVYPFLYRAGVSPETLARFYQHCR